MSAVCLYLAGRATVVAASAFTLAWTHSVEKTRWEEDWRLGAAGLELLEARIKGSGAGMEVPDGARLRDGVWVYRPTLPPQKALLLARSGATGEGWEICGDGRCTRFGTSQAAPAEIRACRP
jgi:hypothetical protein